MTEPDSEPTVTDQPTARIPAQAPAHPVERVPDWEPDFAKPKRSRRASRTEPVTPEAAAPAVAEVKAAEVKAAEVKAAEAAPGGAAADAGTADAGPGADGVAGAGDKTAEVQDAEIAADGIKGDEAKEVEAKGAETNGAETNGAETNGAETNGAETKAAEVKDGETKVLETSVVTTGAASDSPKHAATVARTNKALAVVFAVLAALFLAGTGVMTALYVNQTDAYAKEAKVASQRSEQIAAAQAELTQVKAQLATANTNNTNLQSQLTAAQTQLVQVQSEKATVSKCLDDLHKFFIATDANASDATLTSLYNTAQVSCDAANKYLGG